MRTNIPPNTMKKAVPLRHERGNLFIPESPYQLFLCSSYSIQERFFINQAVNTLAMVCCWLSMKKGMFMFRNGS
jgi:hypothetical protein